MLNIKTERVADLSLINGLLLTNEAEADVHSLVGGGGSNNKQLNKCLEAFRLHYEYFKHTNGQNVVLASYQGINLYICPPPKCSILRARTLLTCVRFVIQSPIHNSHGKSTRRRMPSVRQCMIVHLDSGTSVNNS